MSTLFTFSWWLVVLSVAYYVGRHVGRKCVRGWMSGGWMLVLSFVFTLTIGAVAVSTLNLALEYVIIVAAFVGSVFNGAGAQDS